METRNKLIAACLVLVFSLASVRIAGAQKTFNPVCHPFQALEIKHAIDTDCPNARGNVHSHTSGHALQNTAKNNFCAPVPLVDISHAALIQLQHTIEHTPGYATWDSKHLPPSRDPFTKVAGPFKEGMLVRYTGFILELHAADTTNGESVNCYAPGPEANDIHIAFVAQPTDAECSSITAEMSPHFRPKSWVASKMAATLPARHRSRHKWVPNPQGVRLSRVTGQLMFDAAHKPCTGGVANVDDPSRASDWEIHPVYALEVCKTAGSSCAPTDWEPLDQFLNSHH